MKTYLAGPMTGYPQFNFPLFHAAADWLRANGFDIVSPAELDSPEVQKQGMSSLDGALVGGKLAGETWGDMLARDVKVIADSCQQIALLPDWSKSRGARLEAFVGLLCGHKFFRVFDIDGVFSVTSVSSAYVVEMIYGSFPPNRQAELDV